MSPSTHCTTALDFRQVGDSGKGSWKIPASIHQLARDRCRSGIANMSQPSVWSGARSPQEFEPHSLVCGCPTLCGERISQRVTFSVLLIVSQVTRRISGGLKGREKDWKMSSTIDMTEEEFYKEVYDYGTLWLRIRIWACRWIGNRGRRGRSWASVKWAENEKNSDKNLQKKRSVLLCLHIS